MFHVTILVWAIVIREKSLTFSFNLEILKFAEPQLSFAKSFSSEGKQVSESKVGSVKE